MVPKELPQEKYEETHTLRSVKETKERKSSTLSIIRGYIKATTKIFPYTELTLVHIFDCPAILAALHEIGFCFRHQISVWIILNRFPEQSSGPMVQFDLVPSWTRHHQHLRSTEAQFKSHVYTLPTYVTEDPGVLNRDADDESWTRIGENALRTVPRQAVERATSKRGYHTG
ncbi:hypothetical protein TNCV_1518991 [Trichonephila clavipes]|nr:hypothetical protein TNCV_1518991 [Trichonephila clavipes]